MRPAVFALLAGCATVPAVRPAPPPVAPLPPPFVASDDDRAAWDRARRVLDVDARPRVGEASLAPGFAPDPWRRELAVGGGRNALDVADLGLRDAASGEPCGRAFVARQPDLRVTLAEGLARLRVYVASVGDTTLLLRLPDGAWRCNDDHGRAAWGAPRAPVVELAGPAAGRYDVWIGTYEATARVAATVHLTTGDAHP